MPDSPKRTCTVVLFLEFCCLLISVHLPLVCLFVECGEDVSTPWTMGATVLSLVSSVLVSYPLRVMPAQNINIEKHPGIVNLCFAYWVLSIYLAAYKWNLWLPESDYGILTFASYIFYIFVFYMAELVFHHCVSALDPRLGLFETVHEFLWDAVRLFREILVDIPATWNERWQRASELARGRPAEGRGTEAAVVIAPETPAEQASSVPPPYPATSSGHFSDILFSSKTNDLPPTNV